MKGRAVGTLVIPAILLMIISNYSGGSVPDRISRIAWCREDVCGGSGVRDAVRR